MILSLLAAAALLAETTAAPVPAAAPAAPPAAQAPDAKAKAKPAKAELVCTYDASLGTRVPQKRCRTKASIAEERAESRSDLNRAQLMTPLEATSR